MLGTEPSDFRHIAAPALGLFAVPAGPAALFGADRYARLDSTARAQADRAFAGSTAWAKAGRDRFRAEVTHGTVVELPGRPTTCSSATRTASSERCVPSLRPPADDPFHRTPNQRSTAASESMAREWRARFS
jgi:hypothetical protein